MNKTFRQPARDARQGTKRSDWGQGETFSASSAQRMNAMPAVLDSETRAVIAVSFVTRAALAAVMGFSFDETYDVVVARKLALSYYDHPPAIMWLIAAVVKITGGENHLIVHLP